ncbi:hypothetical protein F53441_11537 [Fusarium austroafricanum]|uniref:Uncharacterized protein n=1 Tax=Fusarium austroafricanum TaxID=2364996 RepID=A0A8H4K5G8_9HYPO|nr:hypothetical protein F53441_11537 [Fusarium austroafricanum]
MSLRPRQTQQPLGIPVYGLDGVSVSQANPIAGRPGERRLIPCPENSWAFTNLVSAINIGLEILESPPGRGVLGRLASQLIETWGVENEPCFRYGTPQIQGHIDTFLSAIRRDLFMITIEDLGSPSILAGSNRELGGWNGDLASYLAKSHAAISYNIRRVQDMCNASAAIDRIDQARNSSSAARAERKKMILRHKHFQFMFAAATVHEICHIFVGYISQDGRHGGGFGTPPSITHLNYGRQQRRDAGGRIQGESGRWVENRLFGGTLEFYQNNNDDAGQVGILHILDAHDVAHRVTSQAILNFIEGDRQFVFPLETTGTGITRRQRGQEGIRSIGSTEAAPYQADYLFMRSRLERMPLYNISRQELNSVPERPRIIRAIRVR